MSTSQKKLRLVEFMSLSFFNITCDGCSFNGSSLATFGRYIWSHNGKLFPIDRQMGLCEDCDNIVAIEKFPEPVVMERARKIRPILMLGKPLLFHLEDDEAQYLASQKNFNVLERLIYLNRPPVCLQCAGSAVHAIKIPKSASGGTLMNLGIKHPGCSGHLKVQGSGSLRISMRSITRLYDLSGKLTATIENDDLSDEFTITPHQYCSMKTKTSGDTNRSKGRPYSPKLRAFLDRKWDE